MNWPAAIAAQTDSLLRVIAMLYAMLGVAQGAMGATVTRGLRLRVLCLLRSAESAVRRLLVVEAQGMTVPEAAHRDQSKWSPKARRDRKAGAARTFPVIEPLQRTAAPSRKYAPGPGPRISCFDGFDAPRDAPAPPQTEADPVDAARVLARLAALRDVLNDPQKYARRLARWSARHRSKRVKPLRPGRPPGHRSRRRHPVDWILAECHELALSALVPPDTS